MNGLGVGGAIKSFGELENSGLPLQKSPHKNIREEPSLSDTRLAKHQAYRLPMGCRYRFSNVLQPVFLNSKKNIVHFLIGPTDE